MARRGGKNSRNKRRRRGKGHEERKRLAWKLRLSTRVLQEVQEHEPRSGTVRSDVVLGTPGTPLLDERPCGESGVTDWTVIPVSGVPLEMAIQRLPPVKLCDRPDFGSTEDLDVLWLDSPGQRLFDATPPRSAGDESMFLTPKSGRNGRCLGDFKHSTAALHSPGSQNIICREIPSTPASWVELLKIVDNL